MRRFKVLMAILIAVTALVAVLFVFTRRPTVEYSPVRALWVTRFDYDSPADVDAIINNVGAAGFTDVFFQIRGNGTAFYKSELEPWASELSGHDLSRLGTDPGWDPLQRAIDAAQPHGLRVHAYMNVLPGWKGLADPPAAARQVWTEHRDWFMVDSLGDRMLPTSGWYSFLNPVLPEVRRHLRGVVSELCRYDIAGVHLDYIRYPHDYHIVARQRYPDATDEEITRRSDFSYDEASQAALFQKYGWDVTKDQIADFRRESITKVVRDISYVLQIEKPNACLLTASVMGNPIDGKHRAYQDSGAWARQGLVDWVVQMNYATKSFTRHLESMKKAAGTKKFASSVVVGLYLENDAADVLEQLEIVKESGARGFAIFSYTFLFGANHEPTEKGRKLLPKLRP
mgnify:CR=1 FL=1